MGTRIFVILLGFSLLATPVLAKTPLRFDRNRGVLGTTEQKREWLEQAIRHHVANDAQRQQAMRQLGAMNAAQIDALANHLFAQQLAQQFQAQQRFAGFGFHPFGGNRVVGYRPVITWLPEGTSLGVGAVVSPDRRYVRINAAPFFSHIPQVDTFNFATGQTTRQYYHQPTQFGQPMQRPSAIPAENFDPLKGFRRK